MIFIHRALEWAKKHIKSIEGLTLLVSVPAAVLAVIQAISAGDSAKDAAHLLEQARRQADSAEQYATAASLQADYMEKLAGLSEENLSVAKNERDAAQNLVQRTADVANATADQASAIRNAAQAQITASNEREWNAHRAKLSVRRADISELQIGKRPDFHVVLENRGQTNARNVRLGFEWHDGLGIPVPVQFPACIKSDGVIVSNSLDFHITRDAPWSKDEAKAYTDGEGLVVLGRVCYKDERGQEHETTICRFSKNQSGYICGYGEREF